MHNSLINLRSRLTGGQLHLGIATDGIALMHSSSTWSRNRKVIGEIACTQDQLLPAYTRLLTQSSCRGLPLKVTLGSGLGQLFMVTPPLQAEKNSVLVAAAGMRFQALFGKNKAEWHIEADWQIDRPFLACAYPQALLTDLRELAQKHRSPLLSIKPYFVEAWNIWRNKLDSDNWFGLIQDNVLTLGMTSINQPPELAGIRSITVPKHGYTTEWIEEQLHRAALQHGLTVPRHVQIAGNSHQYWREHNVAVTDQHIINLPVHIINTSASAISAAMEMVANENNGSAR